MMSVSYYLFALIIISINRSHGYLKNNIRHMSHSLGRHLCASEESGLSQNQVQISDDQVSRSLIPKRKDTCKMFISGIIGTEPKEAYLNNNHYVINFALAVTGHYDSLHDWEKAKPQETMWINVEVWDKIAKDGLQNFRKGASLNGLGTLIFNRWTDKASGEERKQFKYRLQKLMTADEMAFFNDSDLTVIDDSNISSGTARVVFDVSQTSGELRTLQTQRIDDKAKLVLSKAVIEEVPVSSQALVNTDPTSIASANLITERIASRSYDRNLQTNSPITDKRSQQSVDRQMPNQGPTAPSGRSRITYGAYDPDME